MAVADRDGSLLPRRTGRMWFAARHSDLRRPLTTPAGLEWSIREITGRPRPANAVTEAESEHWIATDICP
jgi:hypothetical protein